MQSSPTPLARPSGGRSRAALVPWLVLAASLVIAMAAGQYVARSTEVREHLRFESEVQHARKSIQDRLDIYIAILRSTAGLFAAYPDIDVKGFRRYTERVMSDDRYAGVQGIGFTVKIPPGGAAALEARMRREGRRDFQLWTSDPKAEQHAIVYLEPEDTRNRLALGYNMYSDPVRRAAMARARDTGQAAASGAVRLVQEFRDDPNPQHGFLIYVPVYRNGALPANSSVEARRRQLIGFAYSPFRMADLLTNIFPEGAPSPHIRYDIYDSAVQTSAHVLYHSAQPSGSPPRYTRTVSIDAGGRQWTAVFATQPGFDAGAGRTVVPLTYLFGIVISLLLFGITSFQVRSREEAEQSADALRNSITAREAAEQAVREGEDQLRALYEEARAARAEAETANRLKDEFLATVSHELRTPLNAIMGYSQLLSMGARSPEQTQRALSAIERNVRAQAQLIDDLLDVSRIVSGKLRLEMDIVDPALVARNALEAVSPEAEAKGVSLAADLEADAGVVWGDPGRLQQVVWNLLSNAIKFTPKAGKVTVRLRRRGDNLELSVEDNGKGIAPEMLGHIFDRFRQADSSTTRQYGGLGLGLSIVRELVDMHHGTVWAESPGEAQGATFTVRLPAAARERARAVRAGNDGDTATAARLDGVRALIVEDDADARALLREVLEEAGARVEAAASAGDAMGAMDRRPPDILISDIGMPGEDGYALIARVRALPEERGGMVPAVALTAFARAEDRRRCLEAGFQRHAAKPVEPKALVSLVRELLGSHGSGHEAAVDD